MKQEVVESMVVKTKDIINRNKQEKLVSSTVKGYYDIISKGSIVVSLDFRNKEKEPFHCFFLEEYLNTLTEVKLLFAEEYPEIDVIGIGASETDSNIFTISFYIKKPTSEQIEFRRKMVIRLMKENID